MTCCLFAHQRARHEILQYRDILLELVSGGVRLGAALQCRRTSVGIGEQGSAMETHSV
jgi:hypothetical protein